MNRMLFLSLLIGLFACGISSNKPPADIKTSTLKPLSYTDILGNYRLVNEDYGTQTTVTIEGKHRKMVTNALPNHSIGDFPNPGNPNRVRAQNSTYQFPMKPVFSGESKWAREPGVAVNGIKFEPETAERFVCETGEVYRIEAIQELVDLGLDHNFAHVQPTGAYHYHGVPTELVQILNRDEDLILVGFAKDGFLMYYSKNGRYKPSYVLSKDLRTGDACNYRNPKQSMEDSFKGTSADGTFVSDWTYLKGHGDLDECNGIEINGQYVYFITEEYPYVSRCLKGKFKESRPPGPPPGHHRHPHPPRHGRGH